MGPSLAKSAVGIVYLKPGPPLRGRMTMTASAPFGAFSGAMVRLRWPTDA